MFDITVLSRPDANTIGLHNRAIESGLFESGRPILLSPPVPPKDIATNVMIHWNCSTEQARATAFAMPLLHAGAARDGAHGLGRAGGAGADGRAIAQASAAQRHPGKADDGRARGQATPARRSCARRKAEGCDLLVKGAFTQSRLRQMIFGGATSHILAHAELPVLMAH